MGVQEKFDTAGVASDVQVIGPEEQDADHPEKMNWWDGGRLYVFTVLTVGIAYMRLNRPNEALSRYKESLEIKQRLGNKRGMAASYVQIGEVQKTLGNPAEADFRWLQPIVGELDPLGYLHRQVLHIVRIRIALKNARHGRCAMRVRRGNQHVVWRNAS